MTDMEKVREEERQRLTLEALADVDAVNVIDNQAVQAWANSLNTEAPLPVPHHMARRGAMLAPCHDNRQ